MGMLSPSAKKGNNKSNLQLDSSMKLDKDVIDEVSEGRNQLM
jgi:hypothetical protein